MKAQKNDSQSLMFSALFRKKKLEKLQKKKRQVGQTSLLSLLLLAPHKSIIKFS